MVCVSCRLLGSPCAYHTARAVRAPQSELARLLRAADAFPAPTGAGFEALVAEARAAAPLAGELPDVETIPQAVVAVAAGRETSLRERYDALAWKALASDASVAAFRRIGGRAPAAGAVGVDAAVADAAEPARLAVWRRSEAAWLAALARTLGARVPDRAADLAVAFAWGDRSGMNE